MAQVRVSRAPSPMRGSVSTLRLTACTTRAPACTRPGSGGSSSLPRSASGINLYRYIGNDALNRVDPTRLTTAGGLFTTTLQHVKHLVLSLSYTNIPAAAFAARLATAQKQSCGQCGVENASLRPQWLWRQ